MINAIVYQSKTGHTKKYAEILSTSLNLPTLDIQEAKTKLKRGDEIIYLGWVCASKIMGLNKVLSRDYGEGASSGERGRKASRKGADLLLSIHGNSAADPTARGFECYPQLPGRDTHAASLRFARLLGGEMADAGALLRGEEGVRYAVYDSDGQKRILNSADGVAGSTFGVLEQADCPAVLAEQCFLTSAEDVAAFAGEEGCTRAAEAYYRAICRYFSTTPQL